VFGNILAFLTNVMDVDKAKEAFRFMWGVGVNEPGPVANLYPVVQSGDPDWKPYYTVNLLNLPHHYHNGGIWPFVGGMWVRFIYRLGLSDVAGRELVRLAKLNRLLVAGVKRTALPDIAVTPLRHLLRYVTAAVTGLLILDLCGVETQSLYAGLVTVLAMVAIGFVAVWSVLSHFMCTFLIIAMKPFGVGDYIEFAGEPVKGKVVDLTLLYTVLRTENQEMVQIPNNLIFKKVLIRKPVRCPYELSEQLLRAKPLDE
jgi:small-conductance mechanosensitive channel